MSVVAASRAGTPCVREPLQLPHPREVAVERRREPRRRVAARLVGAVEHRLRQLEQLPGLALCPGIGERERRHVGDRRDELLDLGHADRLALRPGRDLVDLVREAVEILLADVLDQERARVRLGLDAGLPEALGDPGDPASLGDVVEQQVAALRARLRDRRVLLHLEPDEREHGVGRGRRQVGGDRLDVGSLPAAGRRAARSSFCAVDVGHDDEPRVAEQAARVAERDDVGPARLERRDDLDRLGHEARPQALHRRLDLRPVAARDQVGGLQRRAARSRALPYSTLRPDRQASGRRTRARCGRSRRCGRPRARDARGAPPACRPAGGRSRCERRPRSRATRGRSTRSSSARPGSDEPWWATLSTSTGRSGSARVTSDSESPVRSRSIVP